MKLTRKRIFTLIWITTLTLLGGATNIAAFLLFGTTITHHTGNISKAALDMVSGEWALFALMLTYLGLFGLGSVVAGFLFYRREQHLKHLYSAMPMILGASLLVIGRFFNSGAIFLMIISFGMGLQNGTYYKVRGIVVRTTHMTGYLTDAAFSLGAVLKGNHHETWKVVWYFSSIFVFFLGGIFAALVVLYSTINILDLIAVLYIALGLFVYGFNPQLEHNWF